MDEDFYGCCQGDGCVEFDATAMRLISFRAFLQVMVTPTNLPGSARLNFVVVLQPLDLYAPRFLGTVLFSGDVSILNVRA